MMFKPAAALCVALVPARLAAAAPLPPAGPLASLADAIARDAATALDLAQRQLAVPPRAGAALPSCAALVIAGILLAWPIRLALLSLIRRLAHRADPQGRLRVEAKAAATILFTMLLFGIGAQLALVGAETGFVLLPAVRALANTAVAGITVAGLGLGIGRALRSPDDRTQRPLPLPAGLGRAAAVYPLAGGVMLGLAGFVQRASVVLHASVVSWTIAQIVLLLVEAILAVRLLVEIGRARDEVDGARAAGGTAGFALTSLAWAAIIVGLAALLFGHVRFAALLFQEIIWAALVVIAALLMARFLAALIAWLLGSEHVAGRFAAHIVGVGQDRIAQASILASALAMLAVWALAIGLIVAPLGGGGVSLVDQVRPGLLVNDLRNLHIAPRVLAAAVLVLAVGVALTRLLRRWLERRFLPATSLDIGVRSSIVTGLSYAGVLLALLAATSTLGINLDKITLIASALSVGIGFGLQSIIQNFVSGVILLIERPITVGDWVSASGAEGSVRRIRVRATELVTADGSIAILPNSSFISSPVQNRSAAGVAGRMEVTIKVSGSSSPAAARDAILELVRQQQAIRTEPAPRLLFTDAGDAGFGFTLQAYGTSDRLIAEARSDLLYALVDGAAASGLKASIS